jgi:hypothetical protein
MFRSLWGWLNSFFSSHSNGAKVGQFDAIIEEAQSEVAAMIDRYRRARRAA